MNYDIILDKIFFNNDIYNLSKIISYNKLKKKKYQNIQNYIINRFDDSESERETLYRIHYKIYEVPTCPICGKKLKFNGKKNIIFLSHCSNKCKKLDKEVNNKWKSSCGELGTNREKSKQTMIQKYGVENPYQIPEVINKIKEINKIKKDDIINNMKKTCQLRYGVDYYFQSKLFIQKTNESSIKKYGTKFPIQSDIVKNKYDWKNIVLKINDTKSKNNSYNISQSENESYELLKNKYHDIKRQYQSIEYPFNCDFYIPSLDLYIECNYHWTHGGHLFNENNYEDIKKLNLWKSKNTKYYNNAINTWTQLDIRKNNIAKNNNLNYIIFWNIDELKKWINNYDNN